MRDIRYRLGDTVITSYGDSFHTWEKNMVLGEHRSGYCTLIGDVLVFEPWTRKKDGYLKLEHHSLLKRLPAWTRTRYCMSSTNLRDSATGGLLRFPVDPVLFRDNAGDSLTDGMKSPCSYSLGRYRIALGEGGTLTWETCDGTGSVRTGRCRIESGILFLGPETGLSEKHQTGKSWSRAIARLPRWELTPAWSREQYLHSCQDTSSVAPPGSRAGNSAHRNAGRQSSPGISGAGLPGGFWQQEKFRLQATRVVELFLAWAGVALQAGFFTLRIAGRLTGKLIRFAREFVAGKRR